MTLWSPRRSSVATLGNPAQMPRSSRSAFPIGVRISTIMYEMSIMTNNTNMERRMNIGIIGAGALGSNVARLLAKSGISATIANSRGPASLAGLIGELGPFIEAGTVREAASADVVLVAVRWVDLGKALAGLPAWNGRLVIDGPNPAAFLDPDSPDAKDPNNPLA